jgi:transposase
MAEQRPRPNYHWAENAEHRRAFEVYLAEGRSVIRTAAAIQRGVQTVRRWAAKFEWRERGDALDRLQGEESSYSHARDAQKLLEEHRQATDLLLRKGMDYLERHGIDSSRDAVLAIKLSIELSRRGLNLPDLLVQVLDASDVELAERARRLIEQLTQPGPEGIESAGDAAVVEADP